MALWHPPIPKGLPKLLLGHGNGLNSLCQIGLIRALSDRFDVYGVDFRGHGATRLPLPDTPEDPWGWYVSDLEQLIERHFGGHVLYAGHSLAAVTAFRLARMRPELFTHLIALDPAILSPWKARLYPLARKLGLAARVNRLYKGALSRRHIWAHRAEALAYFTGRKAFATWRQEAVKGYVDGGLKQVGHTLRLACPREWEARTFKYVPTEIEHSLRHMQAPCLLIRALEGSLSPKTLHLHAKTQLVTVPGTHFAHLEHPEHLATIIKQAIP